MPLDGLTLGFMARELNAALAGARIERVNQPEKDITDDANKDTEKPEAIPYRTAEIPLDNTVRHYNVFDLQGRLVAKFKTVGIEDLQGKTYAIVQRAGTYLVKSSKGGQTYRIAVRK